jgi:hypothetical protein
LYYYNVFCFLGVARPQGEAILLVVNEATSVGTIKDHEIFKIDNISAIPLQNTTMSEEAKAQVTNLTNLLKTGFYFSLTYDLTNAM